MPAEFGIENKHTNLSFFKSIDKLMVIEEMAAVMQAPMPSAAFQKGVWRLQKRKIFCVAKTIRREIV